MFIWCRLDRASYLPRGEVILGPGHERVLRHLWTSSLAFSDRGAVSFSLKDEIIALQERAPDYAGGTISVRRKRIAEKVIPAWPKVGKACVVPIRSVVDAELQAELDAPDNILLPEAEWPTATPKSKVHASDDNWYLLCRAGFERGMFKPFPEDGILTNNFGDKVMAGAMGVDKVKEINGCRVELLRFICILCPINAYMRQTVGDSWSPPQSCLLCSLILGEDECIYQDGEDLESCFNLFTLPEAWSKYVVFAKKVAMSAFGGAPGVTTYVAMRAVPMGWINSVALLQHKFTKHALQNTGGAARRPLT